MLLSFFGVGGCLGEVGYNYDYGGWVILYKVILGGLEDSQTMILKIVFYVTLLLLVCGGVSLDEKSFARSQTLYASSSKTDIKIPQPTEQTPDQEQKQYIKNYKEVIYEPGLGNQFTLSSTRIKDSFFFVGEQSSKLLIQITVSVDHDRTTQLQTKSKPILVTVIDRTVQSVMRSFMVHKNKIIQIEELENRLYEIVISLQKQQDESYVNKIITLHGKVQRNQKTGLSSEWLEQFQVKVDSLYDKGALIFLDSLEKWEVIQLSSKKYTSHQQNWKIYSIIELLALVILSGAQLLYLRKLLHNDIVVI